MASFIIALLVAGINVMLLAVTLLAISSAGKSGDGDAGRRIAEASLSSSMMIICTNIMSVPLCLVGLGLGLVSLVSQKTRNHLFSWIGFFVNGVVIVAVLALFVMAAMATHAR